MEIGVAKESAAAERRVALTPAAVKPLARLGLQLVIEAGAGEQAGCPDAAYTQAGATVADRAAVLECPLIAAVRGGAADAEGTLASDLSAKHTLVAQCDPLSDAAAMRTLASGGARIFALELVPRISRAQSMDVLSSMASLAGYKAVILAAASLDKQFPLMMTAAGTVKAARVFVLGAGVAGLQAIATAKRLGAVVTATDVRPDVKEQVESLGGRFVDTTTVSAAGRGGYAKELDEAARAEQRERVTAVLRESDVVITTAAVPGRKAPVLLTAEMTRQMPAGSVVVDLAAERGGNCELTRAGQEVTDGGITIIGPINVPSSLARDASLMYSNNVVAFLKTIVSDGSLRIDTEDEIVRGTMVCQGGELTHPVVREAAGLPRERAMVTPDEFIAAPPDNRTTIPLAD